tara:strand:+ start:74 stop:280 length:207 start_codon:yes stop_codon:yes gene_type:complete
MSDFVAASDNVSPLLALLWVFYPMGALVLIELLLRFINGDNDDDDDGGGKGIRIRQQELVPVTVPSGA